MKNKILTLKERGYNPDAVCDWCEDSGYESDFDGGCTFCHKCLFGKQKREEWDKKSWFQKLFGV